MPVLSAGGAGTVVRENGVIDSVLDFRCRLPSKLIMVSSLGEMMLSVNNLIRPWSDHEWRQRLHRKTQFFLKLVGVKSSVGVEGEYWVFAPQYSVRFSLL